MDNHENINPESGDDHLSPEQDANAPQEYDEAPDLDDPAQDAQAARIQELELQLNDTKDQMLRALAEQDNVRKRLMKDREDLRKYAISDFAKDLLDFSDNFKRALDSIPAEMREDERINNVIVGVEAMRKDFLGTMEKHGITKSEPLGQPFNPNFHEAMFEAPGTGQPAGSVIEVIEPGYLLHDRLLRPARVGIAKDDAADGDAHVDVKA